MWRATPHPLACVHLWRQHAAQPGRRVQDFSLTYGCTACCREAANTSTAGLPRFRPQKCRHKQAVSGQPGQQLVQPAVLQQRGLHAALQSQPRLLPATAAAAADAAAAGQHACRVEQQPLAPPLFHTHPPLQVAGAAFIVGAAAGAPRQTDHRRSALLKLRS